MIVAAKTTYTVDDLAAMPEGDRYELVNGELVERAMSPESAYVAGEIYARLRDYCRANPIAWALPDGAGFTVQPEDVGLLRRPDASVVLKSRLPDGRLPSTRFEFAPDLAVEVLSPTDIYRDVDAKIREYLDAGTALVWLARPEVRRIVVFRPDGSETSLRAADEIIGDPVLPGFRMRVGDVFPEPVAVARRG